jgi:hypothetical protein
MIMKGLWRYHAIKSSQNRNPSRKHLDGADGAGNRRITAPADLGITSRHATRRGQANGHPGQAAVGAGEPLESLISRAVTG